MSTHNICFYGELTNIILHLSSNTLLICSSDVIVNFTPKSKVLIRFNEFVDIVIVMRRHAMSHAKYMYWKSALIMHFIFSLKQCPKMPVTPTDVGYLKIQ